MLALFKTENKDLSEWTLNFEEKLPVYASQLGIGSALLEDAINCSKAIRNAIIEAKIARLQSEKANEMIEASQQTNLPVLRGVIQKLKTSNSYTDIIGSDLQINGADVLAGTSNIKPVLSAEIQSEERILVHFTKRGFDGVNIYSRSHGESKWTKICYESNSPYVDNPIIRNGLQNREYYCKAVIDDIEIGKPSNMINVIHAY